jgi:hypothetical protein
MHTLFDFITQVKGVEYLIAVSAVGVFIVFWEVMKPRPFKAMVDTAKSDLTQINQTGGFAYVLRTVGHVAAAPFIGLAYVVSLPFVFVYALGNVLVVETASAIGAVADVIAHALVAGAHALARIVHVSPAFSWRPQEAYFLGRKRRQRADRKHAETKREDKDPKSSGKEPADKEGGAK